MSKPGRARDPEIDRRVLEVARRQLGDHGYESMSLAAVAHAAGTTRQALYRRWPTKADLAAAAVQDLGEDQDGPGDTDPFVDLVRELTHFQRGVSHPGRLSLVGTMLQDSTDAQVRARYRAGIIAPRRERLRELLQRGIDRGLLAADADLEVGLTMCTGAWYARALAGLPVPRNWPTRCATLVWRALGGVPPAAAPTAVDHGGTAVPDA